MFLFAMQLGHHEKNNLYEQVPPALLLLIHEFETEMWCWSTDSQFNSKNVIQFELHLLVKTKPT